VLPTLNFRAQVPSKETIDYPIIGSFDPIEDMS